MFRHIVLFRIRDDAPESDVESALARLRALGDLPGVASWVVERSTDERKGRVLIEDGTFDDRESFALFRSHRAHVGAGEHMAAIADWLVGDYETAEG